MFLLVLSWIAVADRAAFSSEPPSGASAPAPAPGTCLPGAPGIRIRVRNVLEARGTITVDLHGDKASDFLKKELSRTRVAAVAGETSLCIAIPGPGLFAVVLYQDLNQNRRLDKNVFGIPVEPVGVSNDPPFFFRPPRFEEAVFPATESGADVVITLRDVW